MGQGHSPPGARAADAASATDPSSMGKAAPSLSTHEGRGNAGGAGLVMKMQTSGLRRISGPSLQCYIFYGQATRTYFKL